MVGGDVLVLYLSLETGQTSWVIADLHLFHDKFRVENGTELLIDFWENNVDEGDFVFLLGDVCFNYKECKRLFKVLPGKKILVKGNHDHWSKNRLWRVGYDMIVDDCIVVRYKVTARKVYRFCMSHYYMTRKELENRFPFHIDMLLYGHSHKKRPFIDKTVPALNVCPEWTDYRFLTLDDVVAILNGLK